MSSDKRRNSFYLVISILVALGIWVYVDLTQGITASKEVYNIPIEFQGEDTTLAERGLMLLPDSETTIDLKLEGAKLILAQLDTAKLRVQADLSAVTETGVQTVTCRVIYPEYKFSSNLTATTPTNSFNITIDVGELYSREVEIRCDIQGTVAEGYIAGGLQLSPGAGGRRQLRQGFSEHRGCRGDRGPGAALCPLQRGRRAHLRRGHPRRAG